MRMLIGLVFVVGGLVACAARWESQIPLPNPTAWYWLAGGIVAILIGAGMLLPRAKKTSGFSDGPLINTLKNSGFSIQPTPDGWLAKGSWKDVPLVVRKSNGYQAARFARPWTVVVAMPGHPIDPWPLYPEEGLIVEEHDSGFTVSCTDLSRVERMHRLGERLNLLVTLRRT